jgi:hypothetical protein
VTLVAGLTKLILMRIFMAIRAVELTDTKILKFLARICFSFMALGAIDSFVFPGKSESGIIMVELRDLLKIILAMAT